jgi:tyrosyl-tRNA synthetase
MTFIEELKARESFYQASSNELEKYLEEAPRTFYLGVDPTADSLQVGNWATLNIALHLMNRGHKLILVVGGATGMIGDPSGKNEERNLLDNETLQKNVAGITKWCEAFFGKNQNWQVVNNYDWFKNISYLDFLRDVGKNFSINTMLKKDSVANRLGNESFFSYTEFSYSLLQAYDFLYLFEKYNCTIQIGASDQWGNMTAGVELIHKKLGKEVYVLTGPLVTNSKTGKKLGKSEAGTIWLDKNKTNSYELYQFFLNTPDEDIVTYIKRFIALPIEQVDEMVQKVINSEDKTIAQKSLAYAVVAGLHGEEDAVKVQTLSEKLFSNEVSDLSVDEYEMLASVLPKTSETNIIDALITTNLASSKREAKEFIEGGAVMVGGERITDTEYQITQKPALIKKGKKDYGIVM